MNDDRFHISARKKEYVQKSIVVRISADAYNAVVEMYNDSTMSISQLASSAILFAHERAVYDKEEQN